MKPESWSTRTLVVLSLLVPHLAAAQELPSFEFLEGPLKVIGMVLFLAYLGVMLLGALGVLSVVWIVMFLVRRAKSESTLGAPAAPRSQLEPIPAAATAELPYPRALRLRGHGLADEAIHAELVRSGLSEDDATIVINSLPGGSTWPAGSQTVSNQVDASTDTAFTGALTGVRI